MNVADIWFIVAGMAVCWMLYKAMNRRDCPECKGTGTFIEAEGVNIPCHRCGGTGKI